MKKYIFLPIVLILTVSCEQAEKIFSQAQDATNQTLKKIQDHIELVDLDKINFEHFESATDAAKNLAFSVNSLLQVDLANLQAIELAKKHLTNAYACLATISSEKAAEQLLSNLLDQISNDNIKELIKQSTTQASNITNCITSN